MKAALGVGRGRDQMRKGNVEGRRPDGAARRRRIDAPRWSGRGPRGACRSLQAATAIACVLLLGPSPASAQTPDYTRYPASPPDVNGETPSSPFTECELLMCFDSGGW